MRSCFFHVEYFMSTNIHNNNRCKLFILFHSKSKGNKRKRKNRFTSNACSSFMCSMCPMMRHSFRNNGQVSIETIGGSCGFWVESIVIATVDCMHKHTILLKSFTNRSTCHYFARLVLLHLRLISQSLNDSNSNRITPIN